MVQSTSKGCLFIWANSYVRISSHYEKLIFQNFEILSFWAGFTAFLSYFFDVKTMIRKFNFFRISIFGLRELRYETNLFRESLNTLRPNTHPEIIGMPKNRETKKLDFWLIFNSNQYPDSLTFNRNSPKCQNFQILKK